MTGGRGGPLTVQWQLPATARSVVDARRHVASTLVEWELESLRDAALLLTSELVTNAVLHARTPLTLTVERDGDGLRVSVRDGSPLPPSLRRRSSQLATTGRGLRLLQQLADEWQADEEPTGKSVWFTLSPGRDPWAGYNVGDWVEAEA